MSARIYHKPSCGTSRNMLKPDPADSLSSEDGPSFLHGEQITGDDPGFAATLLNAGLPIDDLAEVGRIFYAYHMGSGRLIGYGGFECYGRDVLLRSIVVLSADRRQGMGHNLLTLLLRRAYNQGARQAWLLTETAVPFFERAGFETVTREHAPQTILATRQAQNLCPGSATLMALTITS